MESKHIVFLAETEYHLMVSINLALTLYKERDYTNSIYYWVSESRLNYSICQIPDFNGQLIPLNVEERINEIKKLVTLEVSRFVFFQESNPFLRYLAYTFKRRGAAINLAPDGYKPYGFFSKKHEWVSMLIDTWNSYRILRNSGFSIGRLELFWNYRYGSSPNIDEVLLHEPLLFNSKVNKTKSVLKRLPDWDQTTIELFPLIFDLKESGLSKTMGVLFYINQPLWSEELIQVEMDILKQIRNLYTDKEILIKLHPHTPAKTIELYKGINNVRIIQNSRPAELFMTQLKGSIIFSGWSAALLFEVSSNNYFYLYEIFNKVDDKTINQFNFVSFPHIQTVNRVNDIVFPV